MWSQNLVLLAVNKEAINTDMKTAEEIEMLLMPMLPSCKSIRISPNGKHSRSENMVRTEEKETWRNLLPITSVKVKPGLTELIRMPSFA